MKKTLLILLLITIMALAFSGAGLAHEPQPGCAGLDQAHDQIHGSDTPGEQKLHDLRAEMGCSH